MTVKQAAAKLGVSDSLMYALLSARKIRHERHGLGRGKIVITDEALEEYRRRRTVEAQEGRPAPAPKVTLRHLQA
jgi:excisionase family DNA binding protein